MISPSIRVELPPLPGVAGGGGGQRVDGCGQLARPSPATGCGPLSESQRRVEPIDELG